MASNQFSANFAGDHNSAIQIGQNFGTIQNYSGAVNQLRDNPAFTSAQNEEFRGSYFSGNAIAPVPNFVARPRPQELIVQQLQGHPSNRGPRILIVSGLGGAGKSQIALEYLESHRDDYVATFWIDATTVTSIETDFMQMFHLLYPSREPPHINTTIALVKTKLQGLDQRRLVVFDGADEIEDRNDPAFIDLPKYLPRLPGVDIIITTRIAEASSLSALEPVVVKEMQDGEALDLLHRCSKVDATDEIGDAVDVIKRLGNFALAISMAGAYIREESEGHGSFKAFLDLQQESQDELYRWVPHDLSHQYGKNIVSSWETSYKAVERRNPHAARLLTCIAFINYNNISLDIFRASIGSGSARNVLADGWMTLLDIDLGNDQDAAKGARTKRKRTERRIDNIPDLKRCFNLLHIYSFVNQSSEHNRTVSMHKLVAEWAYYRYPANQRLKFAGEVLRSLANSIEIFPSGRYCWENLLPHGVANFRVLQRSLPEPLTVEQSTPLDFLSQFVPIARFAGQHVIECQLAKFTAKVFKRLYPTGHRKIQDAMEDYAMALTETGPLDEAELIARELYDERARQYGLEAEVTTQALNILGDILYQRGDYEQAVSKYSEALSWYRRHFSAEHQLTLHANSNLAMSLRGLGRLTESAEIDESILNLETDKRSVLTSMNNLSCTYLEQGRCADARAIQAEALRDCRQLMGDRHPLTLACIHTLGTILDKLAVTQNDEVDKAESSQLHDQAAKLFSEALAGQIEILGEEHVDTLLTRHDVAWNMHYRGQHHEAIALMSQVATQRTAVLGAEHPHTRLSRDTLVEIQRQTEEGNAATSAS